MTILYVAPQMSFLIVQNISTIEASAVGFAELIISLLGMVSILIVALSLYFLFSIYQAGVVIHNIGNKISGESKPYAKSLRIGFSRYPSIFDAAILLSVLSILIGSIRYIGWLLNLIISCAFLLVYQTVVSARYLKEVLNIFVIIQLPILLFISL